MSNSDLDDVLVVLNLLLEKTVKGGMRWIRYGDSYFTKIDNKPFQPFEVQVGVKPKTEKRPKSSCYFQCYVEDSFAKDTGSKELEYGFANRTFLEYYIENTENATGPDKIFDNKIKELYNVIQDKQNIENNSLVDLLLIALKNEGV